MMARLVIERLTQRAGTGSSQPWVGRASDGESYLVKFRGAGPGTYALVAEFVVNTLAARWGYPVPDTRPVWLDAGTPLVGTDEFWDVMRASVGWNLGIRWIPGARDVALAHEDIPPGVLEALSVIDRLFANCDRTTLSNNLIRDRSGGMWLIDHGSCRFLDNLTGSGLGFKLARNHFLHATPVSFSPPRILDEAEVDAVLAPLPDTWLELIEVPRERLVTGLAQRIAAFART